jgi:PatG C-terminal
VESENKDTQSFDDMPSLLGSVPPEINTHNSNGISAENAVIKPCECGKQDCPSCSCQAGKMYPRSYIYAIGKVVHRFPDRSLEMELAQAISRKPEGETKNLTDPEVVHQVLSDANNRYIARQICYVLTIGGLEAYILVPSDPLDVDKLAQTIRAVSSPNNIDVIIGRRGPIAPPDTCNGLLVPIVTVEKLYSFDRDDLIKAIPKRKGVSQDQYEKTASTVFDHLIQIADNTGATDEHRALNYLAVRYDEIYYRTQLLQQENYSLTGVEVRSSPISNVRNLFDVIFTYENRGNRAIQKWFVTLDMTGIFPYLVNPLREYFER